MGIEVWLAAFAVMLVSLIGIIFVQKTAQQFLETKLSFLVSFSAGVFLITAGAIGLEVFEIVPSLWMGVVLILTGYLLAWGINTLFPETHHHHDEDCIDSGGSVRRIIIGDGLHNIADGVVLVTAFAVSLPLGLAVTTSIVVHEFLQEMSQFFILKKAGYSTKKALVINFTVSSTILVGVLLGYFALASHELEAVLLAISAGFFLHVVMHDLLPKRSHHETNTEFFQHVILVIIGALLMGLIANSISEDHSHDNESGAYDPSNPNKYIDTNSNNIIID